MAADVTSKDGQDRGERPEVNDGLEAPTIRAGLMAAIAAGAVVFILVAMAILFGFYRWQLVNATPEPAHAFPEPRLETSIDPRNMPSTPEPGPAPRVARHPPTEPPGDLQRAMQAVAAKGTHAYDPLTPAVGNVVQ